MTILEELLSLEPGLRRRYFLQDHAKEIARALSLGEMPATPAWNPEERWPWIRWRPAPREGAAGRSFPSLQHLETLTPRDRLKFYRANRDAIRYELETFREGHNHF
jgi:hypothetical protein